MVRLRFYVFDNYYLARFAIVNKLLQPSFICTCIQINNFALIMPVTIC